MRSVFLIGGLIFLFHFKVFSQKVDRWETAKYNKKLVWDITEVTLHDWLSYYSWTLKNKGIEEADKLLPDSNNVEPEVWSFIKLKGNTFEEGNISLKTGQPLGYFPIYCEGYIEYDSLLMNPEDTCPFLTFPITGITFDQAIEFCKWRTKILGGKIIYRLPTNNEWVDFAINGMTRGEVNQGYPDSLNSNGCQFYNYKVTVPCEEMIRFKMTRPRQVGVARYIENKYGAYDIFGGVSEMTSEVGIAKGGSYLHYASFCNPDLIQNYDKPKIWLGFRCIGDINK